MADMTVSGQIQQLMPIQAGWVVQVRDLETNMLNATYVVVALCLMIDHVGGKGYTRVEPLVVDQRGTFEVITEVLDHNEDYKVIRHPRAAMPAAAAA